MGKLVVESVEPLLPSVIEFGVVVIEFGVVVLEAMLAQVGSLVDCVSTGQVVALRAPVYSDCTAKNSLLLRMSSVPLDKLP